MDSASTSREICQHVAQKQGLRDNLGFSLQVAVYDKVSTRTTYASCAQLSQSTLKPESVPSSLPCLYPQPPHTYTPHIWACIYIHSFKHTQPCKCMHTRNTSYHTPSPPACILTGHRLYLYSHRAKYEPSPPNLGTLILTCGSQTLPSLGGILGGDGQTTTPSASWGDSSVSRAHTEARVVETNAPAPYK